MKSVIMNKVSVVSFPFHASKRLTVSAFILVLATSTSIAFAANERVALPDDSGAKQDGREVPIVRGTQSGQGGAEGESGVDGDGLPPPHDMPNTDKDGVALSATCIFPRWWVNGSHTWKWRGVRLVWIKIELSAETHTFYGTATDPDACGRTPLIVDRIKVNARTTGGDIFIAVNKTAYNTSSVSGYESGYGYLLLAANPICGARGYHEAYKNGVTWYMRTRSGCY